jgi:antitoxin MazE
VKVKIIRIGDSLGVRIPKRLLDQYGIEGRVEMEVREGKLFVGPDREVRAGWSDAFRRMAVAGDDKPVLELQGASGWDDTEWRW